MSLSTKSSAEAIGQHLQFNKPYIYSHNIPNWVTQNAATYPALINLVTSAKVQKGEQVAAFKISNFKTLAGFSMTGFAKLPSFGKDLYADLVAPKMNSR